LPEGQHTTQGSCFPWISRRFTRGADFHVDDVEVLRWSIDAYAYIAIQENILGQKFVIDATIFSDLRQAGKTDELNDTLDYASIYDKIKDVVEGRPFKLVEALAERIAGTILEESKVESVQVTIQKPHVAVSGVVKSLGVEIYRTRQ